MEDTSTVKRIWGPWATAGFGAAVIAVFFLIEIIVGIIFAARKIDLTTNEGLLVSIATCAVAIICVGLVIIFIKIRNRATIVEYLGLRRITGKTVLALLAITVGLTVLSDGISWILGRPLNPEPMVNTYNTSVWPALLWVAMVVFAPAFEETLFRGFLFEGFLQSRLGVIGTIGLLALAWSLLHFQYGLYEIATIFVSGLVLGVVRFKTASLWSPLLMHSFMNFIASLEVAININALVD